MVHNGDVFYDERNGRYLTADGHGADPKCWRCIQEEMNEDGEYEVTDTVLMMQGELERMARV